MKSINSITKFLENTMFVIMVLFWMMVLIQIGQGNHTGVNFLWAHMLFIFAWLISGIRFVKYKDKLSMAILLFSVLSVFLLVAIVHFNILLPYEMWLQKGMPERL